VASTLLAALITVGGTFAWFTSKDEVTNKLSATSEYDVTTLESFTPPPNWIPGQNVTKNVFATNTGNIDAYVRVTIDNSMELTTNFTSGVRLSDASTATTSGKLTIIDSAISGNTNTVTSGENGNNVVSTDKYYPVGTVSGNLSLVELSKTGTDSSEVKLPDTASTTDEVKAIQAGGRLIYAPGITSNTTNGEGVVHYENATMVGTDYKPKKNGLYIFERDADVVYDSKNKKYVYTYEYSGYYYVAAEADSADGATGGAGTYYAVNIPQTTYTIGDDGSVTVTESSAIKRSTTDHEQVASVDRDSITLKTTQTQTIDSSELKFVTEGEYSTSNTADTIKNDFHVFSETVDGSTKSYLKAVYDGGTSNNTDDDITIRIYLHDTFTPTAKDTNNHVACTGTNWTLDCTTTDLGTITAPTFYYNHVLQAGKTSEMLIESVELDPTVKNDAYVSFDYNLKVTTESVQVVYDSDGKIVLTGSVDNSTSKVGNTTSTASLVEWAKANSSQNAADKNNVDWDAVVVANYTEETNNNGTITPAVTYPYKLTWAFDAITIQNSSSSQ
jgi:predicted ribosomally synthesized peptide with SipW-like signal peptide